MINLNDTIFYTVDDASQLVGVDADTIRRHIRNGALRAQKIGKTYLITEDDMRNFMMERREKRDQRLNRRQNTK